jgi:2,3-bisphosphoglycerate-dependent phosphoglycerate mutase
MFTGWKDADWTWKGRQNANAVAHKLKGKQIDVAFYTKLIRSKKTLHQVLQFHPECFLVLRDDRMMERCYGDLQGHSHAAFIRAHGQSLFDKYHRAYDFPPLNGESVKMVEKRVLSFIHDLLAFVKKYKVSVAISAHGNSMRPFKRYFEKLSTSVMMNLEMPYDDYFEYTVEALSGPHKKPKRADWKGVYQPDRVNLANDPRNAFKNYY